MTKWLLAICELMSDSLNIAWAAKLHVVVPSIHLIVQDNWKINVIWKGWFIITCILDVHVKKISTDHIFSSLSHNKVWNMLITFRQTIRGLNAEMHYRVFSSIIRIIELNAPYWTQEKKQESSLVDCYRSLEMFVAFTDNSKCIC